MRSLKILSLSQKPDGSRVADVCDAADALGLPLRAYFPAEPWNANWKAGDTVEVDAREKTSATGNRYLSLYPTAALANEEPRTMADDDAIRVLSKFVEARLNTIERKLDQLLGINDNQPNFSPDARA